MSAAACFKSLWSVSLLSPPDLASSPIFLLLVLDFVSFDADVGVLRSFLPELRDFDFDRCRRRLFDLLESDRHVSVLVSRFGLEAPQTLHSFRRAEFSFPHSSFGHFQLPGAGRRSTLPAEEFFSAGSALVVEGSVQDDGTKSIDACLLALPVLGTLPSASVSSLEANEGTIDMDALRAI